MTNSKNIVITYPVPKAVIKNEDFIVKVRVEEGEWKELFPYKVQVDMHDVREASMVSFDFSGSVEVEVSKREGTVEEVVIRPTSFMIPFTLEKNKIRFILDQPRKLSIEVNGDRFHNLHLFANDIEEEVPNPESENVLYLKPGIHRPQEILTKITEKTESNIERDIIYFGPGMHYIEEIILMIPSNKTIYMAGGAVIVGSIVCDHVEHVKIKGRGILYLINLERFMSFRGIRIIFSKHIEVEGIHTINPPHYSIFIGQSEYIGIRNFKSFSSRGWSDGIDIMSSSYIEIEDVFLRTSDDCIAIYGRRWEFNGDTRKIKIKNSIMWADVAHPLMIGTHGDYFNQGNTIEDITFDNIDILEHHEPQPNYLGCMAINVGDLNIVKNIRYENIRVEPFENGQLFDIRVMKNPDYNPEPGTKIENIYFKDIFYCGTGEHTSHIQGYSNDRIVEGVMFDNLRINGKHIQNPKDGNISIDQFTYNINFK